MVGGSEAAVDCAAIRSHARNALNQLPTRARRTVLPAVVLLCAGLVPGVHAETQSFDDLRELPFEDLLDVKISSAGKREEAIYKAELEASPCEAGFAVRLLGFVR